jgi:hypothetical protein
MNEQNGVEGISVAKSRGFVMRVMENFIQLRLADFLDF